MKSTYYVQLKKYRYFTAVKSTSEQLCLQVQYVIVE